MSRRTTSPRAPGDPRGAGPRLAPRNWRVATKLNAILLIPVLVALALGGLRVGADRARAEEADDARRVAELARAATAFAHAVLDERDLTARPLLEGRGDDPGIAEARDRTDRARAEFAARAADAPDSPGLRDRLDDADAAVDLLVSLRDRAFTDALPGVATEEAYVAVQRPLMAFANELGLGTDNMLVYGRSVYALSLAKAASSLQRAIGTHLIVAPGPDAGSVEQQVTAFNSYVRLEEIALGEFASAGTDDRVRQLAQAMADTELDVTGGDPQAPGPGTMIDLIAEGLDAERLADAGVTAESWFRTATAEFDAYRAVESDLMDAAVHEAREVSADARRDIVAGAAAVLAAVLLAFVVAGLVARSMGRGMRRLRAAAFDVADHRLPQAVARLAGSKPGDAPPAVAPIGMATRDEVGEIARAFDRIHGQAVRLATEQAALRAAISTLFANLAGRNQTLVERQLALISALETHEADPEALDGLFRLDHLATRMRRNGENLLVLAGEEPAHRWDRPISLLDVLRAAASEVEDYARIELTGVPDTVIRAGVVNDLVHLLAELLENATVFSSPRAPVRVTATRLPDGRVLTEIHDAGIGLSPDDLAAVNARLAHPPHLDAAVTGRMGLFVVGRLAERHGIRVQLRHAEHTGTTALVMLPDAVTRPGPAPATADVPVPPPQGARGDLDAPPAQRPGPRHARRPALAPADAPPVDSRATNPTSDERPTSQAGFDQVTPVADSPLSGPAEGVQRVGCTGPAPGAGDDPRDDRPRQRPEEDPAQRLRDDDPAPAPPPEPGLARPDRGPRREGRTSGTTSAGLPRRVPRHRPTDRSSPDTSDEPRISRDPSQVGGRLSSLRRGVRRGRGAGENGAAQNDEYDQER
ncbi:nitrate- and nitrite sensing domain-containing protein [Streptomyces sp. RFCAC02]|uniref:sensor histidine kinase n=1 Tax=Streptomyces sp. RFCAC02 TaxID=2499143 RepID=UPI00101F37A0|nr:nitrate- and nitrite sensing domain-containing protein [Streptomyces sp. RFCAC02]